MQILINGTIWEASLVADGTLDTVIKLGSKDIPTETVRLSQEFASHYRDRNGRLSNKGFKKLVEYITEFYI